MQIEVKKTDNRLSDFIELVRQLDMELAVTDGEDHAFYDQFNKVDHIKHVLVAYAEGQAAGCGAIKEIDPQTMEIKRMFVPFDHRSKGIASLILGELEAWAKELGYERCILETGSRQHAAIALYLKRGYHQIPNYGQYAGVANSLCFEKKL